MATSSRAALGLVALALVTAGCGARTTTGSSAGSKYHAAAANGSTPSAPRASAFAWLRPGIAPAGWVVARIPSGATMPYPRGWKPVPGDRGTATAGLFDRHGHYLGYLNLTPRQSNETVAGWTRFRVEHNAEEGERHVDAIAAAKGLRFRSGRGACVEDAYTTSTKTRYIEVACLVTGARRSTVIVGASPTQSWSRISPLLERSISSMTA